MKKVFLLAALVAAMASCHSKQQNNVAEIDLIATDSAGVEDITEVYYGTLPAADGPMNAMQHLCQSKDELLYFLPK